MSSLSPASLQLGRPRVQSVSDKDDDEGAVLHVPWRGQPKRQHIFPSEGARISELLLSHSQRSHPPTLVDTEDPEEDEDHLETPVPPNEQFDQNDDERFIIKCGLLAIDLCELSFERPPVDAEGFPRYRIVSHISKLQPDEVARGIPGNYDVCYFERHSQSLEFLRRFPPLKSGKHKEFEIVAMVPVLSRRNLFTIKYARVQRAVE